VPAGNQQARPLAVAGPTASGKSALALALAERQGGWIIDADALQVYRDLRILSARPTERDEARAPHRLYGTIDAAERCSVGRWLGLARQEIAAARAAGARPILCGGTGLYLKALEQGLAEIPPVPAAIEAEERAVLAAEGGAVRLAALAAVDPESAAKLQPGDRQRILRALAVQRATGRPLSRWQQETAGGEALQWIVLLPPRAELRQAVAERWRAMLEAGALEEVRRLLARQLDPSLPAMKAVGVAELTEVLRGETTLAEASRRAIDRTRQYVKRQTTWLRTQVLAGPAQVTIIEEKFSDRMRQSVFSKILSEALTG
jgi:tRNA dimethylallyltransferase